MSGHDLAPEDLSDVIYFHIQCLYLELQCMSLSSHRQEHSCLQAIVDSPLP